MVYFDLLLQGLINGFTYALIAVGLTLVYGLLRILHVAHAGLFTLGAYLTVTVTESSGSLVLGLVVACISVGALGMAIYRVVYEPMLERPPFVALVASIGLFILMEEVFRLVFGPYGNSFSVPPLMNRISLGALGLRTGEAVVLVSAFVLLVALGLFTRHTRVGVGWRATVSDPVVARSFGVDPIRTRYVCFFIASALAAYAGGMVAVLNNLVEPTMGTVPSYKMLAIIVLGGLGSVGGTLVASLILGVVEAFGTIELGNWLDRDSIAFVVLIAVLMLRPEGLKGMFARSA
ncbi:MAG: branched-chain amino acid ABC transporter permease [Burkholderiaceae bacterium]|nr:branched-chain amino acid ABC transporter permease [Burkholderiaceae bacterium]